jgi:hypothetical protein
MLNLILETAASTAFYWSFFFLTGDWCETTMSSELSFFFIFEGLFYDDFTSFEVIGNSGPMDDLMLMVRIFLTSFDWFGCKIGFLGLFVCGF